MWRALKFWPEQHTLSPIVDLWLAYAVPWVPLHALEASSQHAKSQPLQTAFSATLRRHPEQTSTSGYFPPCIIIDSLLLTLVDNRPVGRSLGTYSCGATANQTQSLPQHRNCLRCGGHSDTAIASDCL